jgi:lysophospholipase L1-like esterase
MWPVVCLGAVLLSALGAVPAQSSPGAAQTSESVSPVAQCQSTAAGLSLGAALPRTKERLNAGAPLAVVALGSSSTSGFLVGERNAFPAVMKRSLAQLYPGASIEVTNRGIIMENIRATRARIGPEVVPLHPHLVIWQLGTNDVVWRGIAENAKDLVTSGVRELKAAGADVILMDLQYAPLVYMWPRHRDMQRLIAEVAREQQVAHFPRFALLQRASDAGVHGLVAFDGLHSSAAGHECVGRVLARMIHDAAPHGAAKPSARPRRPPPSQ